MPVPVRVGLLVRSAAVPCTKSPCEVTAPEFVRAKAARMECNSGRLAAVSIAVSGNQPLTSFRYTEGCLSPSVTRALFRGCASVRVIASTST